jgi:LppP/LprE lipoprotein
VRGGLPWKRSARLNVILGRVGPVFADGDRAYFFANGAFVGNDVDDSSVGVRAVRVSSTEIDLVYRLYDGSDPAAGCCLTGKTTRVRFQLTGMTVTALDPVPPASFRT